MITIYGYICVYHQRIFLHTHLGDGDTNMYLIINLTTTPGLPCVCPELRYSPVLISNNHSVSPTPMIGVTFMYVHLIFIWVDIILNLGFTVRKTTWL